MNKMAEDLVSIKSINIKNYKSIVDTTIQLGGFNVFIGANGCGKSNILEAIALGAAASDNKVHFEYFANRGIRITDPYLMFPRFSKDKIDKIIISLIDSMGKSSSYYILSDDNDTSPTKIKVLKDSDLNAEIKEKINNNEIDLREWLSAIFQKQSDSQIKVDNEYKNISIDIRQDFEHITIMPITILHSFLIYSLEESKLRQADASNRIYPLGNHGEGLFSYLKEISKRENAVGFFNELKENLSVFDWFDDIEIPNGQLSNEFNIVLKDSYLDETLSAFDQRSTNEGFLYLLFYLTLIISDETPKFFAIENIDSSFNPKLCREVIKRLIVLAQKHGKQIIATTHNPSVLDGLDLNDDSVRLFTIRRGIDGDTKASRVTLKDQLTIPLSEAWQRGYLGGLPDNF